MATPSERSRSARACISSPRCPATCSSPRGTHGVPPSSASISPPDTLDPVPEADGVAIAVSGSTMWWASPSSIHCVDARLLRPCGDVEHPFAGRTRRRRRIPLGAVRDRVHEHALRARPQRNRRNSRSSTAPRARSLAGPVNLPDFTPARLSVFDGRAWVGFHDTGRLVLVERCALDGCQPGTRASLRVSTRRAEDRAASREEPRLEPPLSSREAPGSSGIARPKHQPGHGPIRAPAPNGRDVPAPQPHRTARSPHRRPLAVAHSSEGSIGSESSSSASRSAS